MSEFSKRSMVDSNSSEEDEFDLTPGFKPDLKKPLIKAKSQRRVYGPKDLRQVSDDF